MKARLRLGSLFLVHDVGAALTLPFVGHVVFSFDSYNL
jgi:hypothetical protein